ncbi:MAG: porin family protein [bacterium]|nr:porin family protein [bacterium]
MKNGSIFASIILFCSLNIVAQNEVKTQNQMGIASFGIYGGINFQNINGQAANSTKLTNSLVTKFHIGINEEFPIAPDFFFQAGIQYIGKGASGNVQYIENGTPYTINRNINLNYVEIPLNLIYKPLLGSGNLILGFGPYIGYAINGKATFSGNNAPTNSDIKFIETAPTSDNNNLIYYKRLDVGANFMVGYQFQKGLFLVLNSQLGLVPINAKTSTNLVNKNTGFGLSLGYRF